jgi:hypothetical protein
MQRSTSKRSISPLPRWLTLLPLGLLAWGVGAQGETAGTWTPVPAQIVRPLARTGHTLVNFNGAGVLFGGRSPGAPGSGSVALSDLWEYTAGTGKFLRLNSTTPLPPARSGHAAAASGIYMYAFFGAGQDGSLLQDVWYYDDFRHCWETQLPTSVARPAARMEHSAVVTGDARYLVFGGRGAGDTLLADLWSYQPIPRVWTQLPDFPDGGRAGHAAVLLGNRMYVLGGTSADGVQSDVWVYDLALGSWAEMTSDGDVPDRFTGSAAAAADFGSGAGGQILLVGGQNETGTDLGATYSITVDPANHLAHWTRQTDHSAVFQAAAAAINRPAGPGSAQNLLLFGGSAAGTPLDQAAVYSTFVVPPPEADLTANWLSQKAAPKGTGAKLRWTLSGSVSIANSGTVKSAASTVRFVLSSDTTADAGDQLLKQVKVAALQATRAKTVKWSVKLPPGQSGAGRYVLAVVDALGQVTETDETNNTVASAQF